MMKMKRIQLIMKETKRAKQRTKLGHKIKRNSLVIFERKLIKMMLKILRMSLKK